MAAETLFDGHYRAGSSLDEIVQAFAAVSAAAVKMQDDVELLWLETLAEVVGILKANEAIVHQVAGELMQKGVCKGKRVQHLLCGGAQ